MTPALAANKKKLARRDAPNLKYASIVIDADTGEVLHQSNADKALHPASLTKVMTLLMLFEAMDQGKIQPTGRIRVSSHAASMPPSDLGLKPGSSIRVKDAIYGLVTRSANDVAAAVAEHLGGSESGFARMMTRRAQALGMTRTRFVNASGLHDPRQISTARDMARLAHFVITQYPSYYRYFSTANFNYGGKNYHNHNRLMESYKGMDGMKTGYVSASGFNLVASAKRGDRRLIGVVFGGQTANSRNAHMAALLDKGFATKRKAPVLMASARDIPRSKYVQNAPLAIAGAAVPIPVPPAAAKPALRVVAASGQPILKPRVSTLTAASLAPPKALLTQDRAPVITLGSSADSVTNAGSAAGFDVAALDPAAPPSNGSAVSAGWAIQVGAYSSRAATDQALSRTLKQLPQRYAGLSPTIAPLKTPDGWLFRARIAGFSRDEALNLCRGLRDCVPVAPVTN